ncbi:MAG: FAD-dependent oxidoreductase [Saccharolobus sp.]
MEKSGGESSIGEARIISKNEIEIERKNIKFKKLIIASGSKPKKPRIEGIDKAISEDEAVRLKSKPNSMVVIGGGYAGTEIAQIFSRLGSNVTLLARKCFLSTLQKTLGI